MPDEAAQFFPAGPRPWQPLQIEIRLQAKPNFDYWEERRFPARSRSRLRTWLGSWSHVSSSRWWLQSDTDSDRRTVALKGPAWSLSPEGSLSLVLGSRPRVSGFKWAAARTASLSGSSLYSSHPPATGSKAAADEYPSLRTKFRVPVNNVTLGGACRCRPARPLLDDSVRWRYTSRNLELSRLRWIDLTWTSSSTVY